MSATADLPNQVVGDQFRLRQVLSNFVANAINFTEYGSITLKVEVLPSDVDTSVRFDVTDTGVEMSDESGVRICEMFTQVVASARHRHQGAGLGLAIAMNLARLKRGFCTNPEPF